MLASDLKGFEMRQAVPYLSEVQADGSPRGELTVAGRFEFVDAEGNHRGRNVRVHKEYSATLAEAQGTVSTLRNHNSGLNIMARFTVNL